MPCRNNLFGCNFLGSDSSHPAACGFYKCLWRSNGCSFVGTRAAIGMHERACDFAVVYCLLREMGCQYTCQRRDLPKHFESCIRQKELEQGRVRGQKENMEQVCVNNDAMQCLRPIDDKKMRVKPELLDRVQQIWAEKPVTLNVGGRELVTSLASLCRYPSSVLGLLAARLRKFDHHRPLRLFLDRDPEVMENVLTFLRYGRVPPDLTLQQHTLLTWEAEYLALPELARALKAQPPAEDSVPILEIEIRGPEIIARSLL